MKGVKKMSIRISPTYNSYAAYNASVNKDLNFFKNYMKNSFAAMLDKVAQNPELKCRLTFNKNQVISGNKSWALGLERFPLFFTNASDSVRDAWIKSVEESGFCALFYPGGGLRAGALSDELRGRIEISLCGREVTITHSIEANVLSDIDSARGFILSIIDTINTRMMTDYDNRANLENERRFHELFLSHLG